MILREAGQLEIIAVKRIAIGEVDTFQQLPRIVHDIDGAVRELAVIAGPSQGSSHLQEVGSGGTDGDQGPGFQPFGAAGIAILRPKVIPAIAQGREYHLGTTLGADHDIEALYREAA